MIKITKTKLLPFYIASIAAIFPFINSCNYTSTQKPMKIMLIDVRKSEYSAKNRYCSAAIIASCDSVIQSSAMPAIITKAKMIKANELLQEGNEQDAIDLYTNLLKAVDEGQVTTIKKGLAIAYLRLGEKSNCVHNHTGESCIFPIAGTGVHSDKMGSSKAIELYTDLLQHDISDKESRWLLNIAYMTLGEYPDKVPADYFIAGLTADTGYKVKPFTDLAAKTGLATKDLGGGNIIDDFNNDGYLDIVTSSWSLDEGMHYFKNDGDGNFTDASATSGLKEIMGGINIMQTDYNNDGLKDIFVVRGGWKADFGREPASLLRNNGNGTFTDVTLESGLIYFHPTQSAVWGDFNNDGWLDVFIAHESLENDAHPCQLYLNNKNGTFTDVSKRSGCDITGFVKGVTSGDYNNDGWPDLFLSSFTGAVLLKNEGSENGLPHFVNVTQQAGLSNNSMRSFATWFWDYNNDGWPDILACDYEFKTPLAAYAAMDAMYNNSGKGGSIYLFKNNHDGSFTNVSAAMGLTKAVYAMGCNFGDIDNDGYPDMYFGTGNPLYQSLIPNKLFRNMQGQGFADVTKSSRTGNLQKGHGVAFADLDNDGDEDIYIEMGGAFKGDAYQNSLYINPGQNNNNWISLTLEGVKANRLAMGAKIKLVFKENGVARNVCKAVNSGGSFGANPMRQHIGIGTARSIDSIQIIWPGSNFVQTFTNIAANQFLEVKEGHNNVGNITFKKLNYALGTAELIECLPAAVQPGK